MKILAIPDQRAYDTNAEGLSDDAAEVEERRRGGPLLRLRIARGVKQGRHEEQALPGPYQNQGQTKIVRLPLRRQPGCDERSSREECEAQRQGLARIAVRRPQPSEREAETLSPERPDVGICDLLYPEALKTSQRLRHDKRRHDEAETVEGRERDRPTKRRRRPQTQINHRPLTNQEHHNRHRYPNTHTQSAATLH